LGASNAALDARPFAAGALGGAREGATLGGALLGAGAQLTPSNDAAIIPLENEARAGMRGVQRRVPRESITHTSVEFPFPYHPALIRPL
jgi:hypothetical protein